MLEHLDLGKNEIRVIKGLEELEELRELLLNFNPIERIDNIEPLERLKTLLMSYKSLPDSIREKVRSRFYYDEEIS